LPSPSWSGNLPSMPQSRKQPHAWYALRRTLPTWSFDENLKELITVLPEYGVDELIIKVDTEEFTHGQPPLKWVKRYQKNLFRIKEAMDRLGILYSLNPWITVGHCDRGRDARKDLPGLITMVGHDGTICTCCACPLSTAWRKHTARVWRLYAQTKPHVMWIEDDIRTFNHLPVRYGCFCREHMRRFSKRVGRKVTREELVAAMLKPGKPHRWRREYLDMQAEVMNDTVAFLAGVVHNVSPQTRLGLMSSGPNSHCLDGRQWDAFATALADGKPLYSRPPMGNYSEESLRGFYYSHDSIKITRHALPDGVVEQTEVENVPFTRYSKSTAFTFIETAISFAYGSHGVTLNLFDHCGTPMESEPVFGAMLRDRKPFLEGLAARARQPGEYAGVQLLFHPRASCDKVLPKAAPYGSLAGDGAPTMQMLESQGIPTTYVDGKVIASSGQTLRSFSDDEIRAFLSKGILLDATAALTLYERGFGKEIGLRSIAPPRCLDDLGAFSAEEFFNRKFGGTDRQYLTLTLPDLGGRPNFSVMRSLPSAEVISSVVDPDARRRHVCMQAFRNRYGGRVVIHAVELASAYGPAFNHTFRAEQLQAVVRWLANGRPSILVRGGGVYPLAFRKECGASTLLGFFNLTLDAWSGVEFEISTRREVTGLQVLAPSGQWAKNKAVSCQKVGGRVIVRYAKPVPFDVPLFITVRYA